MDLYSLIKENYNEAGEQNMWESVKILSDFIEDLDENKKQEVLMKIYGALCGNHYNESFADSQIKKMVYIDLTGKVREAPYYTKEQIKNIYEKVKDDIRPYNMWDFAVTLNMIKSDNENMFKKWWTGISDVELQQRIIDATINWLDDGDNPYGNEKIWRYFNG
jgi:hypothetical protein